MFSLTALFSFFGALAVTAESPLPSSAYGAKWVSTWDEQRCSLTRQSEGSDPSVLILRTVPGSQNTELWLLDPRWAGKVPKPRSEVTINLRPSDLKISEQVLGVDVGGRRGMAVSNLDAAFLQKFAGSSSVVVTQGRRKLSEIPVPNSAAAVDTLRKCEREVLRTWGFNPDVISTLRSPPEARGSPTKWVLASDYPDQAIRSNAWGSTLARLTVGNEGEVIECVIVEGAGSPLLDNRTCAILSRRARFKPAIAADGQPTKGIVALRITWLLRQG